VRILVVEDDRKVSAFVRQGLEEEGHAVDTAADGEQGAMLAHVNPYDVLVLDVQLPKKNGLQVAAELRREGSDVPILMLTARDATEDVVRGLDSGADDYLTKPFAFDELLARVRALGRRGGAAVAAAVLRYVVGGMVTATLLTMAVIPAIYLLWRRWEVRRRPDVPVREALHDELALTAGD
jgi:DNA-binding response OmpR family regulator